MLLFYLYAAILLGILIIVHEVGHFLAARASGVVVERFSIGFGPRILSFQRGGTEYAISLIPLGGYVKMAGMEEGEESERPVDGGPDDGTFLGKRISVRGLIVAAGPVTNFIFAILIYVGVLWFGGMPTLGEPVLGDVEEGTPAAEAGLAFGDRIVSVEGEPVEAWEDVFELAYDETDGDVRLVVLPAGGGEEREFVIPAVPDSATGVVLLGFREFVPPVVGDVMSGGPADVAGIVPGDVFVSVNGDSVRTWGELGDLVGVHPEEEIEVVWSRGGETMSARIVPEEGEVAVGANEVRTIGLIGVMRSWEVRELSFIESAVDAVRLSVRNLGLVIEFFWDLVTFQISGEMVGGPIRVVQIATESARWGGSYFFGFMAFMSINLFVINMLPLPILDGGHLLLMVIEKLRRRRLTKRQLMIWQQIGLIFFVTVMVFLLIRDAINVR